MRTPNMSSAYTGPEPGGHTKSGSEAIADGLDGMDGPDVMDGPTKLGAGAAGLSGTAGATTTAVAGRVTRPAKGCAASVRQFTACAARVAQQEVSPTFNNTFLRCAAAARWNGSKKKLNSDRRHSLCNSDTTPVGNSFSVEATLEELAPAQRTEIAKRHSHESF